MPPVLRMMLSVSIIVCYSCSTSPEKISEQLTTDSIHNPAVSEPSSMSPKSDSVYLKSIVLDEKSVMGNRLLAKSPLLINDILVKMSITKIDSVPDRKGFRYHILDTLFLGKEIRIVLIGREYTEENIIWMAVYGKDNNLIDSKEFYYDNSEGFRSVSTEIRNNLITVNTNNDYAETTAEQKVKQVFFIDGNYKIERKR